MTKTYEECLDEVARNHGYNFWEEYTAFGSADDLDSLFDYCKEAALLYGESKWNQACEEIKASSKNFPSTPPFKP